MTGQMSIFDYIESPQFSFDNDINTIVEMLDQIVEKNNLKAEKEWTVWQHVPNFGYRLAYDISYHVLTGEFIMELNEIIKYARKKKIELSVYYNDELIADDGYRHMDIYSTFIDKKRRKIK